MNDRKVGNIGQGDFIKLCADAGLSCGTSQGDDYAGWDFFVDFPLTQIKNALLDEDERAIECKVQVKSSDNTNKSVQVKLSNLKRFCDSTLPCFFFIAEYNGKINPDNIYLIHTDEALIFKILKRLRENQASENLPLNRITMNITYSASDEIKDFSGKALKEKIESYVKDGMNIYVKRKGYLLKTLGYESSNYEMKFEINSNDDYTSLMRAYLGYPEKINIKNIISWSKRFNIKLTQEELTQEKATIEFLNIQPTTTGEVVFESADESVSFPCEYYFAPLAKTSPKTPILRAKCDNIDMLFNNDNSETKITFLGAEKVIDLFEMRDLFLLMKFLFIDKDPISFHLKKEDGVSIPFKIGNNTKEKNSNNDDLRLSILSIDNLIHLATKNRLESKIKLSMNSLRRNAGNIIGIYNLLNKNSANDNETPSINIETESNSLDIDLHKSMCIVFAISLSFESIALSFICSARGLAKESKKGYSLENYSLSQERVISGKNINDVFKSIEGTMEIICEKRISENSYVFNSVNKRIMFNHDI